MNGYKWALRLQGRCHKCPVVEATCARGPLGGRGSEQRRLPIARVLDSCKNNDDDEDDNRQLLFFLELRPNRSFFYYKEGLQRRRKQDCGSTEWMLPVQLAYIGLSCRNC